MKYRTLVAVAFAAGITLLAGCASSSVVAGNSVASPSSASAELPEPIPTPWLSRDTGELSTDVVSALLSIRETAPTEYPLNYAGVATGTPDSKDVLVIYLADSNPDIEFEFRTLTKLPEDKLQFEFAYQSLEAAQRIDREIMAGVPALRAQGIELQTFGVGVDGVEDIGMDHPTDEQVAYLFAKYGPYLRIDQNVGPARLL